MSCGFGEAFLGLHIAGLWDFGEYVGFSKKMSQVHYCISQVHVLCKTLWRRIGGWVHLLHCLRDGLWGSLVGQFDSLLTDGS